MAVFKTHPLPSPTTIYVISFLHISLSVWLRVEEKVILLEKLSSFTSMFLVPYEAQCKKTLRCFGRQTTCSDFPGQTERFPSMTIRNPPDRWVLFKEKRVTEQESKNPASGTEICERQDSPGLSAGLNPLKLVNAVPRHCSLLPHHRYQDGLIQRDSGRLSSGVPRAKTPLM